MNHPLPRLRAMAAVLVLLIPLLGLPARAQNSTDSKGLNAAVDKLFSTWDKPDSPGCVLSVVKDGQIVYKRGYGMADLDHDIPLAPDSVMHVASISKQFTALAIMLLAREGKLSLDDEVQKYVPEVPDFGTPLTIGHLLHHTSGLRDHWFLLAASGYRPWEEVIKDEDILYLITRMKSLNFKPRDQFLYSNTGYQLAALIVKKVSGKSLREFSDLHIFKPLGMSSTFFRDNHASIVKRQAYGYRESRDKAFFLSMPNFDTPGSTNLLTTVEDLARWDQNFYDKRVGGDWVLEQMQTPDTLNNGDKSNYALGQRLTIYRGLRAIEHSGGDAGFRSHYMRFPEQRFSVVCLCNIGIDASQQARRVADIHLAKELAPIAPRLKPVDLITLTEAEKAARIGGYWNSWTEDLAKVTLRDGRLHMDMTGLFGATSYVGSLFAQGHDRFLLAEGPGEISFETATDDHPQRLIIKPEGARAMIFDAVPPATNDWQRYVGTYYSDELDTTYWVALESGRLIIKRKKSSPIELQPVFRDGFAAAAFFGYVRFTRVRHGAAVDGFVLAGGRIRSLRFARQRE